jgi:hypothetical protein
MRTTASYDAASNTCQALKLGETIFKGHRSYELMVQLQLGIRWSTGRDQSLDTPGAALSTVKEAPAAVNANGGGESVLAAAEAAAGARAAAAGAQKVSFLNPAKPPLARPAAAVPRGLTPADFERKAGPVRYCSPRQQLDPCYLRLMESCDAASNICQTIEGNVMDSHCDPSCSKLNGILSRGEQQILQALSSDGAEFSTRWQQHHAPAPRR